MKVETYLEQVPRLNRRINKRLSMAERLRKEGRLEEWAALEREVTCDIDRFVDLQREILSVLREMKNGSHAAILERRYLNGCGLERIAAEFGCCPLSVGILYGEALREFAAILLERGRISLDCLEVH